MGRAYLHRHESITSFIDADQKGKNAGKTRELLRSREKKKSGSIDHLAPGNPEIEDPGNRRKWGLFSSGLPSSDFPGFIPRYIMYRMGKKERKENITSNV